MSPAADLPASQPTGSPMTAETTDAEGVGAGWTSPHRGYVTPEVEAAARRIAARRAGGAYIDAPTVSDDAWRCEVHAADSALYRTTPAPTAPVAVPDDVRREAAFLLDRLSDFENDGLNEEDGFRNWSGHVWPSMSRLRTLLSAQPTKPTGKDAAISVDVQTMKLSDGRADYFVRITCGRRSTTPHVFRERYKAEYHVDHYKWVFGLRDEDPDLMAYDERSHPEPVAPAPIPADEVREVMPDLQHRCLVHAKWMASDGRDQVARVLSEAAAALARPSAPGEGLREAVRAFLAGFDRALDTQTGTVTVTHDNANVREMRAALSRPDTAGEGRRPNADDLARWLIEYAMLDPTPARRVAGALLERDDSPLRASPSPDTAGDGKGWQLIETAPKEPDTYGDLPGDAQEGIGFAIDSDTGEVRHLLWWDYLGGGVSETTHWQPLPAPPVRLSKAEG